MRRRKYSSSLPSTGNLLKGIDNCSGAALKRVLLLCITRFSNNFPLFQVLSRMLAMYGFQRWWFPLKNLFFETLHIKNAMLNPFVSLKSTQYKKLAPNALRFTYWNLKSCKTHEKIQKNPIKMLNLLVKNWKLRVWCYLFHYFHVICKISNFNMWTAKHLAQASRNELTLLFMTHPKLRPAVQSVLCNDTFFSRK